MVFSGTAQAEEWQHRFFNSAGTKIHYVVGGRGEPVILIHGFASNLVANWSAGGVPTALVKRYRVIALDNRGHGRSDKPHTSDQYGVALVDDIVRLMDHLEIPQAHVVGFSMGGLITNKLLTLHPERVKTATLGGAGWLWENDTSLQFFGEIATSLGEGHGLTPLLRFFVPPGSPQPSPDEMRAINRLILEENDPKALAAALRGMPELTVSERELRANAVPTLALIGGSDPLRPKVDELAKVMANLRVVVIGKADHMATTTDPKFIAALKAFLAEHRD